MKEMKKFVKNIVPCNEMSEMFVNNQDFEEEVEKKFILTDERIAIVVLITTNSLSFLGAILLVFRVARLRIQPDFKAQTQQRKLPTPPSTQAPIADSEASDVGGSNSELEHIYEELKKIENETKN